MNARIAASKISEPWYRSPMLWFAVALPALTVAAGVVTYRIAASDSSDAEPDEVRRVAQMQTLDLAQDEAAARLDLSADALIDPVTRRITLQTEADVPGQDLQLRLIHITHAKFDQSVMLTRTESGHWVGAMPRDLHGAYSLALTPTSAQWRLVARMDAKATRFKLLPLLGQADD